MSSPSPKRSDSAGLTRYRSLHVLLGVLMVFVLGKLILEMSFVFIDGEVEIHQDVSLVLAAVAESSLSTSTRTADKFYPDEVFTIDWSQYIKKSDILHQAALHRACLRHKTSVIPWTYGQSGKNEIWNFMQLVNESYSQRLQKLRRCPDFDVFVPERIRNYGYCEDAAAYTKFLKARMLPYWALDPTRASGVSITYHDLCPNTPVIFFNHYSDGLLDLPNWPANVILCKTALCVDYLNKWHKQEGNPRGTKVLYTRHTTSNLALVGKSQLNADGKATGLEKDFANVSFVHTAGSSTSKGTRQMLGCWLSRPDLPRLDVYVSQSIYDDFKRRRYLRWINNSSNIFLHTGQMEPAAFGQLISKSAYFMCLHEGYGHYINQARSSRALIVTTDIAPMNELITPTSGALIPVRKTALEDQFLGGTSMKKHALRGVEGYYAVFQPVALCDTVATLLNTTIEERVKRADKALQQYYFDTVFFAHSMKNLRAIVHTHHLHNLLRHDGDDK